MLRDLVLLVALGQQPCVWAMGYLSLGEGGRNKTAMHHNRSCFLLRHGRRPKITGASSWVIPATIFKTEDTARERRERGLILGFRTGVAAEQGGCHGRPWMAACELVGSSARATRGLGAAWVRKRRIWGCSPSKQSSCDGLVEEIDDGVRGSVHGAGRD